VSEESGKGERGTGKRAADRRLPLAAAVAVIVSLFPLPSSAAQVPPNATWRTIRTTHFSVHFTPELEEIARRTAANAERAYAQLAAELRPPRGRIDIVVSDNVDYSNGAATTFPSNRVFIYANPPVAASALRFNDDWNTLVVTHELTHVFHLDRVRGIWRLAQGVFGRAPLLFPNAYAPSWLTEGLAVYFESRLTGSGRLVGSEHRMIARSTALEHRFPRLDELSLATPRFPGGQAAYAYGSLLVDHLARSRGPERVRDLVERTSGQLIPFLLNRPASRAFGATFQRAWTELRDSLTREVGSPRPPLPGWVDLTPGAYVAALPRWLGDSAIVYTGATTRDIHGAYRVRVDGPRTSRPRRLGRRNSPTANVPLAGGGLLYSQLDFTDPYHIRSDLYVDRNGRTSRLTRGARLSTPDARADGAIVAAQAVAGGSRLVRVAADGRVLALLTPGGPDVQWMDPRWSPNGALIAAATWRRGGITSVIILDTLGNRVQEISPARAVQGAPSWSPDGAWLLFSSDRSGTPDIYAARVTQNRGGPPSGDTAPSVDGMRIGDAPTGLFEPQLSPDGRTLGAIFFRADGYHVGVAPFEAAVSAAQARGTETAARIVRADVGTPAADTGRVRPYSPWASLRPRYWLPLFEAGLGNGYRLGGLTSGVDLVGRHAYGAQLLVPTDRSGIVGAFDYGYSGLGQPVLGATFVQDWELLRSRARRRTQSAIVSATFSRPRYRTFAALTVGGGVQRARRALVDSTYPRVFVSASWANTYRSAYAISPEGGVTLAGSVNQRWGRGVSSAPSRTYVGATTGYTSLDLPGFARHVVAVRLAGGIADRNATTALEVGGTSGGVLNILPGYAIGSARYPFPVRGFEAASLEGSRAAAASVEYRAPLLIPARGLGLLPLFVDRTSISFFYDAGAAWCPTTLAALCFPAGARERWIASVGGELNLTAAVLSWDAPYRFRLGLAHPVTRPVEAPAVTPYFAIGLAF
jgi:WD40-like Beta Propeller Repeat